MIMANNYTNGLIYGVSDQEPMSNALETNSSHPGSFLYNLSILKDRVHQVESLATMVLALDRGHRPASTALAMPTMGTLVQEIVATASSMMYACQQMDLGSLSTTNNVESRSQHDQGQKTDQSSIQVAQSNGGRGFYTNHQEAVENAWYGETYNDFITNNNNMQSSIAISTNEDCSKDLPLKVEINVGMQQTLSPCTYDIVELDAADILAKYTHYCHVCGKGFKRDANLRMHMRAHGEEYKSKAALSNPMKKDMSSGENANLTRKYSCPQEGCRWNKKHAKFQPLKSMICVKNHYKRSHCPKMYICKRCNNKQFSVLSDLRTHEKHCGDLKWQCSCGNTFSRKDKLMGHVALFVGHAPVNVSLSRVEKDGQNTMQMQ